jgi:phosphatidylglycerophosphatase A
MSKSQSDNLHLLKHLRDADVSGKIALILATWFGAGLFPGLPGTFGTLTAVPLVVGMDCLGMWWRVFGLLIMVGLSIWASGRGRDLLNRNDPPEVVIDEVVGFLFTMFLLPLSLLGLILGFILFRFFDILKPYPIRYLERLRGGLGIVADDLLAALYAHLSTRIILFFVG